MLDLKAQYATVKTEVQAALLRTAESQNFILGPEVAELEKELVSYLRCGHAIGVSSGTDALLIALMAIEVGPGDEVIVPTYSFFATAGVIARLHATPVFVDINPVTFNIDPEKIESRITAKTKAIIPVHLYGQSADMSPIMAIARRHGLKVIEDAAQAIGAQYGDGAPVGTIGDIGCFSFFPSKNLGGFGDGGLVTAKDPALAERLRRLRVHGAHPKYYHKLVGGNFRLDALQAAVLRVKLPHLEAWSKKRRENADAYDARFREAGLSAEDRGPVTLPKAIYRDSGAANYHIYNQYVICVGQRDALMQHLEGRGIGTAIYYPVPFHRQECFQYLRADDQDYPSANRAAETSLALPVYPELTPEQIGYVDEAIKSFYCS
jgi:dTDP-4-amino-4,6-dideoxygalactose transaminase